VYWTRPVTCSLPGICFWTVKFGNGTTDQSVGMVTTLVCIKHNLDLISRCRRYWYDTSSALPIVYIYLYKVSFCISLSLYLSLAQSAYIVAYSELKLRTLAVGPGGWFASVMSINGDGIWNHAWG